jgi:hypothetical protein
MERLPYNSLQFVEVYFQITTEYCEDHLPLGCGVKDGLERV